MIDSPIRGAEPNSNGAESSGAINSLVLEESQTHRRLEAKFTDEALRSIGGPLGAILLERSHLGRIIDRELDGREHPATLPSSILDTEEVEHSEATILDAEISDENQYQSNAISDSDSDLEPMRTVFKRVGDRLRLDNANLKGTSKQDSGRRLVYLFLYAHMLEGRERISREEINAALSDAGMLDSNSPKHFENRIDLYIEEDQIGLRLEGRKKAKFYLEQVLDPNENQVWTPRNSARRKTRKSGKIDNSSDTRPSKSRSRKAGRSSQVDEWLGAWKALNLDANVFESFKERPLAEKGLAGLWAIRRASPDAGKEVSRVMLARFIFEAFEIQIDDRSLEAALKRDRIRVINTQGTKFQIDQTGIQFVENALGIADSSIRGDLLESPENS